METEGVGCTPSRSRSTASTYKLRRWRDEAAVVQGLIRFMVAFYGPDETAKIIGSVLSDERFQEVFLSAQEDVDRESAEIPAGRAADTYRDLGNRFRELDATDWQLHVAGELLNIGVRLAKSGRAERSVEYNEELIRHFERTTVPAVQVLVVRAYFNRAVARENAGEAEASVTGLAEVVTRFGGSNEPDIQECVARALLNRGYLQGRLGEREAAIASYDDAIGRFGDSPLPQLRSSVAMSLLNKGAALADPESPESMDMAVAIWDDLIERFGKDSDPDVQMQVANALTKKAAAQMKMEQLDAAVAASDEAIARYGAADRHDLRRELATALELKAMILNQMGRGLEAIEACDVLVRDFGSIAGQREISVRWRAMGSRIHALILEREESAAVRVFRRMCDDLDVADGEMVSYIVWHTIDVIAAGAAPGVIRGRIRRRCRRL